MPGELAQSLMPRRLVDDGRANSITDTERLDVLVDVGHGAAEGDSLAGTLVLVRETAVLGEPGRVRADDGAFVDVEQLLGDTGPAGGVVCTGVADGDNRTLGLGEEVVLGVFATVTTGELLDTGPVVLEDGVGELGEEGGLGRGEGEVVSAEGEFTPETDAEREDITLSDDNSANIGL